MIEAAPIRFDKMISYDISDSLTNPPITTYGSYFQRVVKRYVLYPIEAGKLGMAAPNIVAVTPYGQIQLKSGNIGIDIIKLNSEAGIPYIGDLKIVENLSTNLTEVGKTIDLTFEMIGDGNLKLFANPFGDFKSSGFYITSPNTKLEIQKLQNDLVIYKQTVQYSVLVQKQGDLVLPSLKIKYYNKSLKMSELVIPQKIIKVSQSSSNQLLSSFNRKIYDKPVNFYFLLFNPIIAGFIVIFSLLPILAFFYGSHIRKLNGDKIYSRKFLAQKRLSKYLSEAENFLLKKNTKEFFLALQKGVFYYITDKLNLPTGLNIKDLLLLVKEKSVSDDLIRLFHEIYQECSVNAYSQNCDESKTDEVLIKARVIFESIK